MASTDLNNRFAVRARLLNEMTDQQARRLAAATDQPPAQAQDMAKNPDELARAWNFTRSLQPEQDFWAIHNQVLQQTMAQLPPDAPPAAVVAAHNAAETQALNAVYPHRGELFGLGTRVIDDQVALADRISRIVQGRTEDDTPAVIGPPAAGTDAPELAPTGGPGQ